MKNKKITTIADFPFIKKDSIYKFILFFVIAIPTVGIFDWVFGFNFLSYLSPTSAGMNILTAILLVAHALIYLIISKNILNKNITLAALLTILSIILIKVLSGIEISSGELSDVSIATTLNITSLTIAVSLFFSKKLAKLNQIIFSAITINTLFVIMLHVIRFNVLLNTNFLQSFSLQTATTLFLLSFGYLRYIKKTGDTLYLFDLRIIFITLLGIFVFWELYIIPNFLKLPQKLNQSFDVVSVDNLYDSENQQFKGEILSKTTFKFEVQKLYENGIVELKNIFDVRTPAGAPIFSVERLYGIDSQSLQHVPQYGDTQRTGYLFGPRSFGLERFRLRPKPQQTFTYWHINYNQPIQMQFVEQQNILGVIVNKYNAKFTADQTNNLTNLPQVGQTRGVTLDVNLSIYVEPTTGILINYEEETQAFFYDLETKNIIEPWNNFSNTFTYPSIANQVQKAQINLYETLVITLIIPALLILIAAAILGLFLINNHTNINLQANLPYVGLTISLILVFSAWYYISNNINKNAQAEFENETILMEQVILDDIGRYTNMLLGAKGLFDSSESVERDEWNSYVNSINIDRNYTGVQGVGYAIFIEPENLQQHIQNIRNQGFEDYTVRPVGERDIYSAIIYLEPFDERNQQAFGFDMYQQKTRKEAMDKALESGEPALSGRVTLVQEIDSVVQPGFLIYLPIYQNSSNYQTVEERKQNIVGFVYSPFRADNLFVNTFNNQNFTVNVEIFDGAEYEKTNSVESLNQNQEIFTLFNDKIFENPKFTKTKTINVLGQPWVLKFSSPQTYGASTTEENLPYIVLLSGIIFTILLYVTLDSLTKAKQKAEVQMLQRTKELGKTNEFLRKQIEYRKESEEITKGLARDLEKFKLAVDATSEQILIANPAGMVLYCNKAFYSSNKFKSEKFVGTYLGGGDAWHEPKTTEAILKTMQKVRETKKPVDVETKFTNKDEHNYPVIMSLAPVLYKATGQGTSEEIEFFILIARDITIEKEIDQAKTEFVSLASHQLKTPLAGINWYTELLQDPEDIKNMSDEQKDYISIINAESIRMVELINSLLNVSRLELGMFAINPSSQNLTELINIELEAHTPKIKEKNITINKDFDLIQNITVDKNLVGIIFQNIISNAIKYTPKDGTVTIRLKKHQNDIMFSVTDTGIGIPEEEKHHIFEKLYRATNTQKTGIEGTGLGMYIVKSIVERSGGKIWFESEQGQGTTFFVTIPETGMKKVEGNKGLIKQQ